MLLAEKSSGIAPEVSQIECQYENFHKDHRKLFGSALLWQQFTDLDHEEMWAIFLTRDNGVIASEMLTKGTLDSTPIDARLILRHALLNNADGVIIVHNHPSGNALPSAFDIKQTQKVKSACDLMGIALVDHLVMGYDSYYSFCDEKLSEYPNSNYQSNGTAKSH